jgi:hypothetical protein
MRYDCSISVWSSMGSTFGNSRGVWSLTVDLRSTTSGWRRSRIEVQGSRSRHSRPPVDDERLAPLPKIPRTAGESTGSGPDPEVRCQPHFAEEPPSEARPGEAERR